MPEKKLWELRLGMIATEAEARRLEERIARLLCPDPDHAPPCPVPWSIALCPEEDMRSVEQEMYRDIREQYRIESAHRNDAREQ
ncbi:hypothetical protein [Nocardia brevicatena]|uniref:hypothetical protein n=1 Tax=Nocardia brevicatena TaxID=37327 RepID=UPI0002FDA837|nr:hypothetical protein [Nocardia brevicatena]